MTPSHFDSPQGRRIAFVRSPGRAPGIVFLGGFRSDMEGTKALHLEAWARARGRAFLRFDYSGHGASSGAFEDGAIGDWAEDAAAALTLTDGPQILVGSSMGGWIALLLARRHPERIAGLVGIAAAPDFTEDDLWPGLGDADRAALDRGEAVLRPSDYGEPYPITPRLIEDGRRNLVLRAPIPAPFPVRLLQGSADAEVPVGLALRMLDRLDGADVRLTLVRGADHRFSTPACLALITATVEEVPDRA